MNHKIAIQLSQFAINTKYEDIPKDIIDFAKGLTLKTVAGILAGSTKPSGIKMAKIVKTRKLPGEAGVLGSGFKTSLWEATMLNAFFAHASELEDDRFNGGVSWDITVIPLLIPLAQKLKLSGKELLEAIVLGLEVHSRTSQFYTEHLGLVIVPGAIGPAVGASKAMGLSTKKTAMALGLAMSGVPLSILNFGTDAHYLESSMQSLQGLISAEMAKQGLISNPDIGTYLKTYLGQERVAPSKMVQDLGTRWLFNDIWIKKYPCCFLNHRQIDALIELMKANKLTYADIKTLEVHTSPADEPCNRPNPKTEGDAQFSFYHVLGAAMLDGDVNLQHINVQALNEPKYKEARSKVKVVLHPDWSKELLIEPARITIKTKDGRDLSRERKFPIGSPSEPLTMKQFRDLYLKFTKGILPEKDISKTADAIINLEKIGDLGELMNALTITNKA